MELTKLLPFLIKHALETGQIDPEDVMAQLQKQQQPKIEDKDTETVDPAMIEVEDPNTKNEIENTEGELLENSFKELDVEDAIEKAKEEKKLDENPSISKQSSFWDYLVTQVK